MKSVHFAGISIRPLGARVLIYVVRLHPNPERIVITLKNLVGIIKRADTKSTLTQRETQVILLISQGCTQPQIARELSISLSTVKSHCNHIFEKLEVTNQAGAVGDALRRGIIK